MKHFIIRLLVAACAFFLGATAATLWAISRRAPTVKYNNVAPVNAQQARMDVEIQEPAIEVRQPGYLKAIEIAQHNKEYPITARRLEDLSADPVAIDLDLGEGIEDQLIILRAYEGESREFKIEQQFETSMTVSGEGPHLDLLDWKHYTSEWEEIKMIERNVFLTSKISESESQKFPKVTWKELYNAVMKADRKLYADYYESAGTEDDPADSKWLKLVRQCKSPQDNPCAVSVSKIRFRIKAKEGERWKIIKRLEFNLPMGC